MSTDTNIIAATFGQATTPKQDLTALAEAICGHLKASGDAAHSFLHHALAVGDALNKAKPLAGHGKWLKFLCECDLGEDAAQRFMKLARHRAVVESNTAYVRNLTLTGALKLIPSKKAKPKDDGAKPIIEGTTAAFPAGNDVPADDVVEVEDQINRWNAWGPEERKAFLNGILLEDFLAVMPADWRPEIERRALSSLAAKAPTAKTKSAIKKVGKLVEGTRLLDMKAEGSA